MSNVQTVQEIYEAFGRGDVPAILERLADDVAWESWSGNTNQETGVPWFEARRGREDVTGFFGIVGGWDMREFSVLSLMDGGDRVGAEIVIDAVVDTGRRLRDEELHLWVFDDEGRVKSFRHYVDTAKHQAAAGVSGQSAPAGGTAGASR